MNSENSINVYYDSIIKKAGELEELSDRILELVNREIGEDMNTIRRTWEGDSGELYVQKVNDTACRLRSRAKELRIASESLKASAERMRNADLFAVSVLGG